MSLGPTLRLAFACLLALASASAQAQIFRAYVASTGNDANPCTLQQPCRLLPAALTAVASGGEIWMLDSANYNTGQVSITKSVTIRAIPGVLGSVVATGGSNGILVNVPGGRVTLRNLLIVHLTSSQYGIYLVSATQLNVAECEVAGPLAGIYVSAANSSVTVKDTVLRGSNTGFYAISTVVATLDNVHAKDNTYGISAADDARVTVSNSVLAGNDYGVRAYANSGNTRVVVESSAITGNSYGVYAQTAASGGVAHLTVSRSDVSHSGNSGFYGLEAASATTTLVSDNNLVTHNLVGFKFDTTGPPTILSRGNNVLNYNGTDVQGGTLTALAAQ